MARTVGPCTAAAVRATLLKAILFVLAMAGATTASAAEPEHQMAALASGAATDTTPDLPAERSPPAVEAETASASAEQPEFAAFVVNASSHSPTPPLLLAAAASDLSGSSDVPAACFADNPRLLYSDRLSVMVSAYDRYIKLINKGIEIAKITADIGWLGDWKPYGELRPMIRKEDYEWSCCLKPTDKFSAKYEVSKYVLSLTGEVGLVKSTPIGMQSVLKLFPMTYTIDKLTGVGAKIDKVLAKGGGGCNLRFLVEGSSTLAANEFRKKGELPSLTPPTDLPPCLTCWGDTNFSSTVLGGGGVMCSLLKGTEPGLRDTNAVQASVQGWVKASPIGAEKTCDSGLKTMYPYASACFQLRVRFYDFLDAERQFCFKSKDDIAKAFGY